MFEIIGKVAGSFFILLVFGDTVLRPSQQFTPYIEPKDHSIEKGNQLNQTSIFGGSKM